MLEEVSDVKGVLLAGVKVFLSIESATVSGTMEASVAAVSGSEVALTVPVKDGYFHPLAKDTRLEVFFYGGSGRYFFRTTVLGRILLDNKPVIVCSMPLSLTRTERREFYRVDTLFHVKILITELTAERVTTDTYNALCVDISGGGMQLDAEHSKAIPLKLNEICDIDFCEALEGMGRAKGMAVRRPAAGKTGWGIKFTKISDSDRDKIIRYVFKKQLAAKKKLESTKKQE